MKAPFTYFGGKSTVAAEIWSRFGDVHNFVDPFMGSNAVLLNRPEEQWRDGRVETVNDIDCMITNFYRAVKSDPSKVAEFADEPVNENELHSRHSWLVNKKEPLQASLEGDPDFFDAKIAGWWVWGMACWIAGGFCSKDGPWIVVDGKLIKRTDGDTHGITKQIPHLHGDKGVNRKIVNMKAQGIVKQIPHLRNDGMGVERKGVTLPEGGDAGDGDQGLYAWMDALSERFRRVRVTCGDWTRVLGPTPTFKLGITAVLLDPPYSDPERCDNVYGDGDSMDVAKAVKEWAVEAGKNPELRIALCGYEGEHIMPPDWDEFKWQAQGGYGNEKKDKSNINRFRERIWFSPACLKPSKTVQPSLFDGA